MIPKYENLEVTINTTSEEEEEEKDTITYREQWNLNLNEKTFPKNNFFNNCTQ